jgi:tetratricopeptide (TPR) repeat protein
MKKLLIAIVVGTLTCAALQGCGGAADRRARSLERGQQFLQEHNYTKARIEFSNALQIEPNDADARYFSAFAAEKANDLRAAAGGYQAALNVDATHALALAALGRLYVFSGLPDKGLEAVEKGLAVHAGHPDLLVVRAAARLALGHEQEAADDATAVLAQQPNNEYAVALLAGIYRTRGERSRAVELVEGALQRAPNSIDMRTVLAQLYLDTGDQERAEVELKRIVELQPTEIQHRQRLVAFYAQTGKPQEAEATLRQLIELQPVSVDNKLALVNFLVRQKNLDAGEAELLALIEHDPKDDALRIAAGQFYESHDLQDDAARAYQDVIERAKLKPPGLGARVRLAALRIRQNRLADARPLVDAVLTANPRDNDALVLRASFALAEGRSVDAITDLRAVLRDQPDSSPVLRTLAQAHARNNEPDLARENYRHAIEVDPGNTQARLEFAGFLSRAGDNSEAKPLLDAILKIEPTNVAALEIQFRVLAALGDNAGVADVARKVIEAQPNGPLGYYMEGVVHEAAHDVPAAIASYERSLEKAPLGVESLGALARVLVVSGQRPAARARLEKVVAQYPDHSVALNLLAELLLADRDTDRAVALAEKASQVNAHWWVPYRTKALALLAKGAREDAKQAYRDGLAASGDAAVLGMDLAALYESDQQPDRAIEVYERLHNGNPGSEPVANNLAMLLTTYREDDASHEKADELVRGFRNSTNPAYLNTYGWVRYRRGQYGEAVSYLRRAAIAVPQNAQMHYHLGMALLASGDGAQARSELEKALASDQLFPGKDTAKRTLQSLPRTPG